MAAPKSDFDALYGQALELTKAFPEYQFKTVTAMLVVIGWLISSAPAQKFIETHHQIAIPWGVAAFVLLAALKGVWIFGHARRIRSIRDRLLELAPAHDLTEQSLVQFELGRILPVSYFLVNTILCIAGSVVLLLLRP